MSLRGMPGGVHYCSDLNQTAFYFYGTRMKLIRRMTTDLFILFTDNQGKRKSDPLSSFYPPHPCAIENTKPFSSFPIRFESTIQLQIRINYSFNQTEMYPFACLLLCILWVFDCSV